MSNPVDRTRTSSGDLAPRTGPEPSSGTGATARRKAGWIRALRSLALLSTGLLAGTFCYGAVNVTQAFQAVPLDVRLTFHTALMRMNGPVMQTAMAVAVLSTLILAILVRNTPRRLTGTASLLVVITFVVTRFGNVPINGQIKQWLATSVPADYPEILQRWELLNYARTLTALAAFVLLLVLVDRLLTGSASGNAESAGAGSGNVDRVSAGGTL